MSPEDVVNSDFSSGHQDPDRRLFAAMAMQALITDYCKLGGETARAVLGGSIRGDCAIRLIASAAVKLADGLIDELGK